MSSPTSEQVDAIIIGVGQAGKPLALTLAQKGWKVTVIERNYVGGSCINYGCTPTKTLVASAQVAHQARRSSEYGIETGDVHVDFRAVMQRKNDMVKQFRSGIEQSFDKAENLTLLYGEARFTDKKEVEVALNEGGTRTLTSESIFIDCGTSAQKPDIDGLDMVPWLNATALMDLDELPQHLIILGGGYIGLEFGQMFRRFGSEVTIIEHGDQLLSREDPDIAQAVTQILTDEGITVTLNAEVEHVSRSASGGVDLRLKSGDTTTSLSGSHLLIAIGTTPNSAALHLEAAGIDTDDHGFIRVNDRLETSQPGVYALGDIKGGPAFTHIAYDDYRIIQQNLLENGTASINHRPVPYTVFLDPQLGRIGLNETEAKKKGVSYKLATMNMTSVARAIETGQTKGLMKVLVDAETDQILGASILGTEGGEIMSMLQIAMMGRLPYTRLRDAVFSHPTLAESLNNLFASLE
ncbi:MAG: mercuric reductase [Bacteroidetes bacterium]|nr:mercuric reductase [Fibrella sp.]